MTAQIPANVHCSDSSASDSASVRTPPGAAWSRVRTSVRNAARGSVLLCALFLAAAVGADEVVLPRHPAISPDGQEIVFSWRGDLWKVSAEGGLAVRLTSHPQDDLASCWHTNGTLIAFESERDGYRNLHVMNPDGTGLRQVTHLDRPVSLAGFDVDELGRPALTFSAVLEPDLYRSSRPYLVPLEGGEPERVHGAFGAFPVGSPDGRHVLFERGGSSWSRRHYRGPDSRDVWVYDRADGAFRQLTTWAGNDGQARWAGPGDVLYLSDRELDCVNLYRMPLAEGDRAAQRLTDFRDSDVVSFDVSADGRRVVLHVWDALHVLDLDRPGPPRRLEIVAPADQRDVVELRDVSRRVTEAALSPDGKTMAVIAFGDVYVRSMDDKSPTRAVTRTEAREKEVAWSPDGLRLYFTTDENGVEEIREATVTATRSELRRAAREATKAATQTPADDAPVPDPAPAEPPPQAEPAPQADPDPQADRAPQAGDPKNGAAPADASQDGDQGQDAKAGGPKPDPKRWQEAVRFEIRTAVEAPEGARAASPSPDGKWLAYRRGLGTLVVRNLESGEERVVVDGWDPGIEWSWSPDSRHLAYVQNDRNFNADIYVAPVDGSQPAVNVTRHPDNESRPRWSADSKVLVFLSERISNENDVWMVYLDKELETYTPAEIDRYYRDAAAAAKKRKPLPVPGAEKPQSRRVRGDGRRSDDNGRNGDDGDEDKENGKDKEDDQESEEESAETSPRPLDLDDAYLRLRRLTSLPGGEGNLEIAPGGDRIIFTASADGGGLFSAKWDGSERKKLGGGGSVQHLTLAGDRAVVVAGGRAATHKVEGGEQKFVDIDATITVDRRDFAERKFREMARTLGERFYHPTMKDLNWRALTDRYMTLASAARTADEFNFVSARLLGELNASHLGVNAPDEASPLRQPQGRLGVRHRRVADGALVEEIYKGSPAAKAVPPLEVGDVIVAVEFERLAPNESLEQRLRGRIGEETAITVRRELETGAAEFTVLVTPISWEAQRQLAYEDFQEKTRQKVAEWSDGRVGYIHIASMSQPQLDEFERDLFAAADGKAGLIIDVRNNGGGWTADRILSSIMVRPHAYTVPRGMSSDITDGYPQDRLFIQRYVLPINMLCNEKSFSNAEIVAHAFKSLERGTLVGQQTYGAVISTGGFSLLDGTSVRLPTRGWFLPNGVDMENNGAMPDLVVPQTPEAETSGEDEQLRAAVEDLLRRL